MKICSTGFARIDLLHLSKLVNIMGMRLFLFGVPYADFLEVLHTKNTSHQVLLS